MLVQVLDNEIHIHDLALFVDKHIVPAIKAYSFHRASVLKQVKEQVASVVCLTPLRFLS